MVIPQHHVLILSLALLTIGIVGVLIRRNVIIILMSIELILNAANLNFVAFSVRWQNLTGQIWGVFNITIAAAEVAVGLAIIVVIFRARARLSVDDLSLMRW